MSVKRKELAKGGRNARSRIEISKNKAPHNACGAKQRPAAAELHCYYIILVKFTPFETESNHVKLLA
jgi:hypothetical protein